MLARLKKKYFYRTKPRFKKPPNNTTGYLIAYNKYGAYCIPTNVIKRNSPQTILSGKVYEQETIDAIKNYYKGGAIIHAGAFYGDFFPALPYKVYAFEPNQESFLAAQITIKLNKLDNIILYNYALGKTNSQMKLKTKDGNKNLGGASYLSENGDQLVDVKSLDEVIDEEISVIHLDTERTEMDVLKGAERILKKYKPVLIVESYDEAYLQSLNYEYIGDAGLNKIFK
ncbi:MAG: FkbM family methyltransferase [Melioribacteraceae bacterium]|nr:FkbM family methyltransferase [Melioribacteraceae bacterium]MCF8353837.1 FkbM family methyltransferase [Melioribacteraceae bacterium]MCF8393070.1 FkbM family methyltransferase [Melioribacteraceae bacterium]MCF8419189.1 FkbM family methyltransferase [Melioribacteraceae bacterium]